MKGFNLAFVMGACYIAYVLGSTAMLVGEMPECRDTPYAWWIIPQIGAVIIAPFVLGYIAGRLDPKADQ
jgi:integral membrane sensor domain MASE1